MKKIFLSLIMIFIAFSFVKAQGRQGPGRNMKPLQRIEQFEKMKLIEVLGLNEETAIRFFTRRNENQKKMKELLEQRDGVIQNLEGAIKSSSQTNDVSYKDQISNLLAIEANISRERENFLRSLSDLLTPQQIAKLVVFESRFRKEVRETLMGRGKGQMNN